MKHDPNLLRTVRLSPYRKGQGPTFTLRTWDTGDSNKGHHRLRYELRQHDAGKTAVIFSGSDFGCSPMWCIDSDESIAAILGFLTLRPGDTDAEYFADYTPEQIAFCDQHAESLSCEAMNRFGES